MANGDTKTNQYLDIAANGTRADLPSDTCCETRTQSLIRGVAERVMDVEDEVERLENNPDVVDIVATYADLQAYDTSTLTDKDVIRVLQDETHDGESTYYRYNKQSNTWTYIGESKQYDDFVGTDGTTAGEAGLVPAPATTDADKYLKSDGTWDTVQAGPTVVQATGTSTTDVMSQDATTKMVFSDTGTRVKIGNNISFSNVGNSLYVAIGSNSRVHSYGTAIGSHSEAGASGVAIASGITNAVSATSGESAVAIGVQTNASGSFSVALGRGATASSQGQFDISTGPRETSGYNNSNYRLLTGLYDPQNAHDAATKGYIDGRIIQNAGAPTTSTVGTVGQLLEDTTNGKLYICTDATNPYVWEEVGGGSVQYYSNAELETLWEGN